LIAIAYDFEQSTHHRRPPAMMAQSPASESGGVRVEVRATGAHSVPVSNVSYQAVARFNFNESLRRLGYDVRVTGAVDDVAGLYLHRRASRQNGGVAYVLAKSAGPQISGTLTLTETETADIKTGKFYLALLSRRSPRLSARADLTF
jgi:CHRD domain